MTTKSDEIREAIRVAFPKSEETDDLIRALSRAAKAEAERDALRLEVELLVTYIRQLDAQINPNL